MTKSNWKQIKLGDVAEITMGQSPESQYYNTNNDGLPFLQGNRTFGIKYPFFDTYTSLSKKIAETGDVIMSVRAPVGDVNITPMKICIGRGLCSLRHKENEQEYLYYLMRNYSRTLIKRESGTVFGSVNHADIANLEINLPPLPIQRRIAAILSCLDDKIELNNRINKNLETQAQTIFKNWFVDFEPFKNGEFVKSELGLIPKGWKVGTFSEICTIIMGQSPEGSSYNEVGDGTVFYQGRAEFGWRYPSNRLYTTQPKRMAKKGNVLLSVRAPVGDINVANEDCCIGRGLAAINCKYTSFILYLMQSLKPRLENYNGEGTVFGCINKDDLHGIKIIIPSAEIVAKYENICVIIDSVIFNNSHQSRNLAVIRDTLLPKLMNGEIEV
jgi:type I restriction enzyme S subunit